MSSLELSHEFEIRQKTCWEFKRKIQQAMQRSLMYPLQGEIHVETAAVTATARKLAVIIWNMVIKQQPFHATDETIYNERIRENTISNIKNKMRRMNLTINDLSFNQ